MDCKEYEIMEKARNVKGKIPLMYLDVKTQLSAVKVLKCEDPVDSINPEVSQSPYILDFVVFWPAHNYMT